MVLSLLESDHRPVTVEELVIKGTVLTRYTEGLEGQDTDKPDTTIYLSEICPRAVGELLVTYVTDDSKWQELRDSHYDGSFLTPYSPIWLSTLDDGRFSIRCNFSHSTNDLIPFAILFHIFSSQEECMQFVARLPGLHNTLLRTYMLAMEEQSVHTQE